MHMPCILYTVYVQSEDDCTRKKEEHEPRGAKKLCAVPQAAQAAQVAV